MISESFEMEYQKSLAATIRPVDKAKKKWPEPPPQLAQQRAHAPRVSEIEDRMKGSENSEDNPSEALEDGPKIEDDSENSEPLPEPKVEPEPVIMKKAIAMNHEAPPAPTAPEPPRRPRRRWTAEQKAAILAELRQLRPGVTMGEVAARNGVSVNSLAAWAAEARKAAREGNGHDSTAAPANGMAAESGRHGSRRPGRPPPGRDRQGTAFVH